MSKLKRLLLSIPAIAVALMIFILSNGPMPELPTFGIVWEDKILHVSAYSTFGISLILFLFANFKNFKLFKYAYITLAIGAFYGITDEFHQLFIPTRTSDIYDWMADVIGISLSIIFIKLIKNKIIKEVN